MRKPDAIHSSTGRHDGVRADDSSESGSAFPWGPLGKREERNETPPIIEKRYLSDGTRSDSQLAPAGRKGRTAEAEDFDEDPRDKTFLG